MMAAFIDLVTRSLREETRSELDRRGLREQGVSSEAIADDLDAGKRFDDAVHEMQADYIRRAATDEPLVQWS